MKSGNTIAAQPNQLPLTPATFLNKNNTDYLFEYAFGKIFFCIPLSPVYTIIRLIFNRLIKWLNC